LYPRHRSSSTARSPASEAPTTTIVTWRSLVDDRDRRLRAAAHGLFDLGSQIVGRRLVEDVEEVVVAHLEHLGRDLHAPGVALAQIEVDHHAVTHLASPASRIRPAVNIAARLPRLLFRRGRRPRSPGRPPRRPSDRLLRPDDAGRTHD